jgi:hypothetical protein
MDDRSFPPFSVRVDPFNWILIGRLGLELEVGIIKWMTVETVPIFVLNDTPPLLSYSAYDANLSQHSDGLGALAGASLGVNFWLNGKAFKGYALQFALTNYAIRYEAKDDNEGRVDWVTHVERQFRVMFGSVSRWGAFTLGGGIGLGYDMNNETRCFPDGARDRSQAITNGDCGQIQLATSDPFAPVVRVTSFTYPWEILARFSLGVTID